jgi:biotin synthase-like enzyme
VDKRVVRVWAWEFQVRVLGMMAEDGHALCSGNMVGMVESLSTQLLGGVTS